MCNLAEGCDDALLRYKKSVLKCEGIINKDKDGIAGLHGFVASFTKRNGVGPIKYKPSTMEGQNDVEDLDGIDVLFSG